MRTHRKVDPDRCCGALRTNCGHSALGPRFRSKLRCRCRGSGRDQRYRKRVSLVQAQDRWPCLCRSRFTNLLCIFRLWPSNAGHRALVSGLYWFDDCLCTADPIPKIYAASGPYICRKGGTTGYRSQLKHDDRFRPLAAELPISIRRRTQKTGRPGGH